MKGVFARFGKILKIKSIHGCAHTLPAIFSGANAEGLDYFLYMASLPVQRGKIAVCSGYGSKGEAIEGPVTFWVCFDTVGTCLGPLMAQKRPLERARNLTETRCFTLVPL